MAIDGFPVDDNVSLYLARYYLDLLRQAQRMDPPSLHDAACHFHASALFAKAVQDTMTRGMTESAKRTFLQGNRLNLPLFVELANNRNGLSHASIPFSTIPNPDVTVHGSLAQAGAAIKAEPGYVEQHLRFRGSLPAPERA